MPLLGELEQSLVFHLEDSEVARQLVRPHFANVLVEADSLRSLALGDLEGATVFVDAHHVGGVQV